MNTLRSQEVLARLRAHAPLVELASRLEAGPFPVDIGEAEGPFAAFIVAQAARGSSHGPILAVVPTDQEAEALQGDLAFLGIDALLLPWWRAAAYRPASLRARVFGERAACLSRLCGGKDLVAVASARAWIDDGYRRPR